MGYIPPPTNPAPGGPFGRMGDPDPHGHNDGNRWKPPSLSTTHIIVGFVLLLVAMVAIGQIARSTTSSADVAIVSPDDGASLSTGIILVRLRVDVEGLEAWTFSFNGPETAGEWREVASESFGVFPMDAQGRPLLAILQPGSYLLRLVATSTDGVETEDTVEITVRP